MQLKLRKIGNSWGVILPADALEALGVRKNGTLSLLPNPDGEGFILQREEREFAEDMAAAEEVIRRYRDTLRELSK
jgi:putative addiction module antidote